MVSLASIPADSFSGVVKIAALFCDCTVERAENAIKVIGQAEAESLLSEKQSIEVRCDFCGQLYLFSRDQTEHIFKKSQ